MISRLFIVSGNGGVLVEKDYRFETENNCAILFIEKLKSMKDSSIPPHFSLDGINYFNVKRNGLYFVACSVCDISPILVVELLSRFYHICKDFCGVVTEQSIQANLLLIYELLDELMNEGYVQLATTDKLRPYIQSTPVVVQQQRSPASDLSSRVFGIESKILPGSAADKPVIQSSKEEESRRNELFVDVVEKILAVINLDGTVTRMEVNGSINIKNFLAGCPQIKIALNEDLVISGNAQKGYGNQVQLDRCSFHKCVQQTDFTSTRTLVLNPPIGEFAAMTYNICGEMTLHQPFRMKIAISDIDASRDVMVTLTLLCDIPSRSQAVNVKVKIMVPKTVSSISSKLGPCNQSSEYIAVEQQIVWSIVKLQGQSVTAQFRLINQGSGHINRHEIGPLAVEFEISGYTSSGLLVRHTKIHGIDKSQTQQLWVRHITTSDSYVFRT